MSCFRMRCDAIGWDGIEPNKNITEDISMK